MILIEDGFGAAGVAAGVGVVERNCFFDPGERVQVQGRLDGWDTGDDRLHEVLGPRAVAAGADGELAATLDIPDNARYVASSRLELTAAGDRGNQAGRVINAGEIARRGRSANARPSPCRARPAPEWDPPFRADEEACNEVVGTAKCARGFLAFRLVGGPNETLWGTGSQRVSEWAAYNGDAGITDRNTVTRRRGWTYPVPVHTSH